jgi:hypothetical protein
MYKYDSTFYFLFIISKMFDYFDESFEENDTYDIDFNLSQFQSNNTIHSQQTFRIICVIYGILYIVGVPTNLFVMYVYAMNKSPIKHTKYSFINLTISDILILFLCIPISINDVLNPNEWFLGEIYCKYICFLF